MGGGLDEWWVREWMEWFNRKGCVELMHIE